MKDVMKFLVQTDLYIGFQDSSLEKSGSELAAKACATTFILPPNTDK
jgi:hypothetical protein